MAKRERRHLTGPAATLAAFLSASAAHAAPPIRTTGSNFVPVCVTPERLMAFIADHNSKLHPRYARIAEFYKAYGEALHVRWDYAFFQMVIETNYLTYRQGNGRRGDVWEDQNNFAGIGATGRGARGERFADVETGVQAQIQHLVAYSGERVEDPVARRTRENQDDIIAQSLRVRHPMTFNDLARRWATDRAYGKSIDFIADLFNSQYCADPRIEAVDDVAVPAPEPVHRPRHLPFAPPSGLGGPKPDHLAGPDPSASEGEEVLPWLAEPVKRPPPAAATSHAKKSKKPVANAPTPSTPKVKTIWSRDDAMKPSKPAVTSAPAPVADDTTVRAGIAIRNSTSEAPAAPVVNNSDATPQTAAVDNPLPWLPTFHIAPEPAVTASRLGGPLPDLSAEAATPPPAKPSSAKCHIYSASYGGTKTLLLRSTDDGEINLTTLTVLDGFEKSMFLNYANAHAKGAEIVGEYDSAELAIADARENCPDD